MKLRKTLKKYQKLAIAFSGGVDSSTLAVVAADTLGRENVLCLHATCTLVPENERELVQEISKNYQLPLEIVEIDALADYDIRKNDRLRCYHCKKTLMRSLLDKAQPAGFELLADALNTDDFGDYRPGIKASDELGIVHPLVEADMNKANIRALAARLRLQNCELPASACLASRVAYGIELDAQMLRTIDKCEQFIRHLGFKRVRVRFYTPDFVKIEVEQNETARLRTFYKQISDCCKSFNIKKIEIDEKGYRQGSLNQL